MSSCCKPPLTFPRFGMPSSQPCPPKPSGLAGGFLIFPASMSVSLTILSQCPSVVPGRQEAPQYLLARVIFGDGNARVGNGLSPYQPTIYGNWKAELQENGFSAPRPGRGPGVVRLEPSPSPACSPSSSPPSHCQPASQPAGHTPLRRRLDQASPLKTELRGDGVGKATFICCSRPSRCQAGWQVGLLF